MGCTQNFTTVWIIIRSSIETI